MLVLHRPIYYVHSLLHQCSLFELAELAEFEKVEEKTSLIDIIRTKQKNWVGHILRGNSPQREIMEGRMGGKRERGRSRQKLMEWTMKDGYGKLKEKAQNRQEWRHWRFGPPGRQMA